jgi:molybdopterin molybdotransferase
MTEVAEAETLIASRMPLWPAARVPLDACADRVLAENVVAERDQPPFDRVTMDGIAIAYDDWGAGIRRFAHAGTQAAGSPAMALREPGSCIEIMTGAICPAGADTIIPVERTTRDGHWIDVAADAPVAARQFIHRQGSDRRRSDLLLAAGARIGPPEVAVLASAGAASVAVAAMPRVAVVSTGDELVGVDEPLEPHQIRSTNDFAIAAALQRQRLAEVTRARLRDDPGELIAAVDALHDRHDVLILSGGVSMGQFDFVPAVLERLGAEVVFHRINQKPGRPMWFGLSRDGKPLFALPGNPVSSLVCTTRYVLPAFRRAAGLAVGPAECAVLTGDVEAPQGMTYFLPVAIEWSDDGIACAEPRPTNTSGDFVSLAGTDGFVELTAGPAVHTAGTAATLFRW